MSAKQNKTEPKQVAVQASLDIEQTSEVALPDNFESAYAELQDIVSTMESGQMSLEDSLKAYQRGDALLQLCQKQLTAVEQQVQILNDQNKLEDYDTDHNQAEHN